MIESLIVEAHVERGLKESGVFDYDAWRAAGAPEAPLRACCHDRSSATHENAAVHARLNELEALYARGADVVPLVAAQRDFAQTSGDSALILLDGRRRIFAAARAGTERMRVFVLLWLLDADS